MNAIEHPNIYMRSLATRDAGSEISKALPDVIAACKVAGFDLVIVETSGIGQGDAAIVPLVDTSLYVMTPEFGAASQLEKIDMLDFADFVAINKFDRKGAQDALRDVRKQFQRNRERFRTPPDEMPVFGTIASRFNDDGVTALYQAIVARLATKGLEARAGHAAAGRRRRQSTAQSAIVPPARVALSRRDRRDGARLSRVGATSRRASRASGSSCARRSDAARRGAPQPLPARTGTRAESRSRPSSHGEASLTQLDALVAERDAQLDAAREEAPRHVAEDQGRLRAATSTS